MIEVTVVGGFLGAGKTTWLTHVLRHAPTSIDALIVNEFSADSLDDALLATAGSGPMPAIYQIAGGCVCCEKLDDLQATLLALVSGHHQDGGIGGSPRRRFHVVLETSGVADPESIVALLTRDPVLQESVRLREVVVLLDGLTGEALLRHHALARAQLRLADRVILSRADLVEKSDLVTTASLVRHLSPGAQLALGCNGAERPGPRSAPVPVDAQWSEDEAWAPVAWTARLPRHISWARYALWLHALVRAHPHRILRSKGIIWTERGPLLVQSMGSVIAQPVALPAAEPITTMVFITQGIDAQVLARSLAAFVPGAVSAPTAAAQPVATARLGTDLLER